MRNLTFAILGAATLLSLAPAPARADGWCWAEARSCPACDEERTWRPRTTWNHEADRDQAYHEIFGDGSGPRSEGGHRRRHKGKPKTAKAAAGAPAAGAPATTPPPDAAATPPPPADAGK